MEIRGKIRQIKKVSPRRLSVILKLLTVESVNPTVDWRSEGPGRYIP